MSASIDSSLFSLTSSEDGNQYSAPPSNEQKSSSQNLTVVGEIDNNHIGNLTYQPKGVPKLITARLCLQEKNGKLPIQKDVEQGKNRYDKEQWDKACKKWGMSVVRTMKLVQTKFWDSSPERDVSKQHNDSNSITIDGCRVEKLHDRLVISQLGSSSLDEKYRPAQLAGLKVNDIIQEVNGIVNPSIQILFDAMKECSAIEMKVKRKGNKNKLNKERLMTESGLQNQVGGDFASIILSKLASRYPCLSPDSDTKLDDWYRFEERPFPSETGMNYRWWTYEFECPVTGFVFSAGTLVGVEDMPCSIQKTIGDSEKKSSGCEAERVFYSKRDYAKHACAARVLDGYSHWGLWKLLQNDTAVEKNGNNKSKVSPPLRRNIVTHSNLCVELPPSIPSDLGTTVAKFRNRHGLIQKIKPRRPPGAADVLYRLYMMHYSTKSVAVPQVKESLVTLRYKDKDHPYAKQKCLWTASYTCPITSEVFEAGTLHTCKEVTLMKDGKIYYQKKAMAKNAAVARAVDCFVFRGGWTSCVVGSSEEEEGGARLWSDSLLDSLLGLVPFRYCVEKPSHSFARDEECGKDGDSEVNKVEVADGDDAVKEVGVTDGDIMIPAAGKLLHGCALSNTVPKIVTASQTCDHRQIKPTANVITDTDFTVEAEESNDCRNRIYVGDMNTNDRENSSSQETDKLNSSAQPIIDSESSKRRPIEDKRNEVDSIENGSSIPDDASCVNDVTSFSNDHHHVVPLLSANNELSLMKSSFTLTQPSNQSHHSTRQMTRKDETLPREKATTPVSEKKSKESAQIGTLTNEMRCSIMARSINTGNNNQSASIYQAEVEDKEKEISISKKRMQTEISPNSFNSITKGKKSTPSSTCVQQAEEQIPGKHLREEIERNEDTGDIFLPLIKEKTEFTFQHFQKIFPDSMIPNEFHYRKKQKTYHHYKSKKSFTHREMAPLIEMFESNKAIEMEDIFHNILCEKKLVLLIQKGILESMTFPKATTFSPREYPRIGSTVDNAIEKYSTTPKDSINDSLDQNNGNVNLINNEAQKSIRKEEPITRSILRTRSSNVTSTSSNAGLFQNKHIEKYSTTPKVSINDSLDQNNVAVNLVHNEAQQSIQKDERISRSILRTRSSNVTSTSSKAGLSQNKQTKLRRLWPDSSTFSKRITKWSPPEVIIKKNGDVKFRGKINANVAKKSLSKIPSSFKDTSDIINKLTPHILEEGLMAAEQEFLENSSDDGTWNRATLVLDLKFCTPVEQRTDATTVRTYEFSFRRKAGPHTSKNNLGELFVIYSSQWKQSRCVLGYIGSTSDWSSTYLTDQQFKENDTFDLFKLRICVVGDSFKDVEDTGWLAEKDLPTRKPDGSVVSQKMYAVNVGTSTEMMRQYEGLKSLTSIKPNLQRFIFSNADNKPQASNGSSVCQTSKLLSVVPRSVFKHLTSTLNDAQLLAVQKIMTGKVRENVALLQGPPGTGKTSLIVGLVSALLNGTLPACGGKSAGTRVTVGRALPDCGLHNSVVSRRILVCAPSNQAVDELVWKLHKGALGPKGIISEFNIVRFGLQPGEERHDGRGKSKSMRGSPLFNHEREAYLKRINLDNMVHDYARSREVNEFASKEHNVESSNKRNSRFICYSDERQKILSKCHVVCCTLSGAGSKAFADAVSRDEFAQSEFEALIIDEACQVSEASCLIPFKYNPNIVVLVGDQQQLPAVTISRDAERCLANRSLFERIYENGWPVNMIWTQYRMHDAIVKFPSAAFYNGQLVSGENIKIREEPIWYHHEDLLFPPYLMWNITNGNVRRSVHGGSSNWVEANFVKRLLNVLSIQCMNSNKHISIGVIAFYNDQVNLLKKELIEGSLLLKKWIATGRVSIQISTVDMFQGSEMDIIVLSCVKTGSNQQNRSCSNDIGFLRDYRRVNVALTRAKHSLWVVCDCNYLSHNLLWNDLVVDAEKRNLVANPRLLVNHEAKKKIQWVGKTKKPKRKKKGKHLKE